jgi:DNA protecting protein DprA
MTPHEAVEVTRIHSVAGLHTDGLASRRPFRAPHHTISAAGLVGGGSPPRPGEATLANHGVLFLDELSEFQRPALEALRQPLEDGRVTIVRAQYAIVLPTKFVLVAATNPCPCGFAGVGDRCRCGEAELRRYRRRLSGPLLDRMDLLVAVQAPAEQELRARPITTSTAVRDRVAEARERQRARLADESASCNGELDSRLMARHVRLEAGADPDPRPRLRRWIVERPGTPSRPPRRAHGGGPRAARARDDRRPPDRAEPPPAKPARGRARRMRPACGECLKRAWLLGAVSGHLDALRARIDAVLALGDRELIAAVGGRRRRDLERRLARARSAPALQAAREAGLELLCRCHPSYPPRLLELPSAPAVLYIAGERERFLAAVSEQPVAIVGARRTTTYGLDTARSLARSLAAAGLTVVSGMAVGIDAAAHEGALSAGGQAVAVLPGPADDPYPPSRRRLYRELTSAGAAISELPPGTPVRRWTFIARNRIIAALSAATVVVEAADRSGALVTAACARRLGRPVGAVPGRITTPQAVGTNGLLGDGARIVRGAQDVLDVLYGIGARTVTAEHRPELAAEARELLRAIAGGRDTSDSLAAAEITPGRTLATLAWLELSGYIRREPGGRFAVIP